MKTIDPPVHELDLRAEAVLDPAIQFPNPLSENIANPLAIFLTGATGFLGVYLLNELLHKTTADIYCLIRAKDIEDGKQRLKKQLEFYSLWDEKNSSRIIPVVGDLSKPFLGISEAQFKELGDRIDVIYHNGAMVNYLCPYTTLKDSNVRGTEEVLRLASLNQTKPVHFVSSISVFFSPAHPIDREVLESDTPQFHPNMKGGYKQSKWVAEKLVTIAQERGLPAAIYRPVRIMGDSKTGITGNFNDLLCGLLKGCVQLGRYPASEAAIDMVPVDYVSQAIVNLSQQQNSFGKAFHLLNSQPIPLNDLFDNVHALGYPLEKLPQDKWLVELERHASANPENELLSFLLLLVSSPNNIFSKKAKFDDRQTQAGLNGSAIACPIADKNLISTYFSYFQTSGYITPPPEKAPTPETTPEATKAPTDFWKSIRSNVKLQNQAPAIKPVPRDGNLTLSFNQERLWQIEQLQHGTSVHNLRAVFRLQGKLDVAALEKSLQEIVRRQEVLRTSFPAVNGKPTVVITPELNLEIPREDLSHLSPEQQKPEIKRIATEEAQKIFDLAKAPLMRVKLVRLSEEENLLVRTVHHIINDVWSDTILLRELAVIYEAFSTGNPSPLPELTVQYADFAAFQRKWLKGEFLQSQIDYWKQHLNSKIPVLQLPTDYSPATVPSYRGAAQILVLSQNLTEALKALTQREGVSLFVTLLAVYKTLLYQYSGQSDIIVCSPLACRNRPETKKLLGYFSNIVLLHTSFADNPTFRELIARVSKVTLGAQEHQQLPFQMLADKLGIPGATLSRTMFTLQNVLSQPEELGGLKVSLQEMEEGMANFDLSISMKEKGEQLVGVVRYKTDLFKESTILEILENFESLVTDMVSDPDRHLSELPILRSAKPHHHSETAYVPPEKEIEHIVAGIWQEVLQLEKIGIHANFFDVGGRSLATIRVYNKVREIFEGEISVVELFKYPTIHTQAEYLSQHAIGILKEGIGDRE